MKWDIPIGEEIHPGNLGCQGCGGALAMRLALKALGPRHGGGDPRLLLVDHRRAVPGARPAGAGLPHRLRDGGGGRLGHQGRQGGPGQGDHGDGLGGGRRHLRHRHPGALGGGGAQRGHHLRLLRQRGVHEHRDPAFLGSTPPGTWTTTTPDERPESRPKKNIMEIMAAHRIPYAATCTPAYPEDMVRKFRKAKAIKGTRFLHILSVCPPGWKMPSDRAIEVMRLAVQSRVFPLYEIEDGSGLHDEPVACRGGAPGGLLPDARPVPPPVRGPRPPGADQGLRGPAVGGAGAPPPPRPSRRGGIPEAEPSSR